VSASLLDTNEMAGHRGLGVVDAAICLYLALPTLLFCAWFKPPVAAALAVAFLYGTYQTVKGTDWGRFELPWTTFAWLLALALAWSALGGTGHWFYANTDWFYRDAVLRDLSLDSWPPNYATDALPPQILRAPVGYYLPASIIGTAGGVRAADIALYLWTTLGFFLVLSGALTLFKTRKERLVCTAILLGFGGLDWLGYMLMWRTIPQPGSHIEWWAQFAQYSGKSTLFFWVPNHALPAWLTMLLILRHWRKPPLAALSPLLGFSVPLWSPLAAMGAVPFFLAGIDLRRDHKVIFAMRRFVPALILALVCARYLTIDSENIPSGWLFDGTLHGEAFVNVYVLFCMFEFGLLSLVLLRMGALGTPGWIAVVLLSLLPLYRFGAGNDIVMRASIPALMVLGLSVVRALTGSAPASWRGLLGVILFVGLLGAIQEPIRSILRPAWQATGMSLAEVSAQRNNGVLPSNYVARLEQRDLLTLMRSPSPAPPSRPTPRTSEKSPRSSNVPHDSE